MQTDTETKPIEILLVEDNPGDVRLTIDAFKEGKVSNNFSVVEDGIEAMAYLRKEGKYVNAKRPDMILLDLNLPRKDGREVLVEVKNDEKLKRIPIIVLTTSKADEDIIKSYNYHANCYISKPVDLNEFLRVVKTIEDFWLSVVKLPRDK